MLCCEVSGASLATGGSTVCVYAHPDQMLALPSDCIHVYAPFAQSSAAASTTHGPTTPTTTPH